MSDAVNLIVYAGDICYLASLDKQKSLNTKKNSKINNPHQSDTSDVQLNDGILSLLNELECGQEQIKRYLNGENPGAIWHLFKPEDADTIRRFLFEYELKATKKKT